MALERPIQRSRPDPDHELVRRQLLDHARRIEHAEVERALSTLDAQGELSDQHRAVIEGFARAVTDQLVGGPRISAVPQDPPGTRAIVRLFDLESPTDADP